MSEPYIGEIRTIAGNVLPRGWLYCDGQMLPISQFEALHTVIETLYGGDGRISFALPDMRGKVPLHYGYGYLLSHRNLGEEGGAENVTLKVNELPSHGHALQASRNSADSASLVDRTVGQTANKVYLEKSEPNTPMSPYAVGEAGGKSSHTNIMPFLCINFMIAYAGVLGNISGE